MIVRLLSTLLQKLEGPLYDPPWIESHLLALLLLVNVVLIVLIIVVDHVVVVVVEVHVHAPNVVGVQPRVP